MLMTVEDEDESDEKYAGLEVWPEGYINLSFVPTVGTVLRFDPPNEAGNDTVPCFLEIWGIDVHMKCEQIPEDYHAHLFAKPEHRSTKESLAALHKFFSRGLT